MKMHMTFSICPYPVLSSCRLSSKYSSTSVISVLRQPFFLFLPERLRLRIISAMMLFCLIMITTKIINLTKWLGETSVRKIYNDRSWQSTDGIKISMTHGDLCQTWRRHICGASNMAMWKRGSTLYVLGESKFNHCIIYGSKMTCEIGSFSFQWPLKQSLDGLGKCAILAERQLYWRNCKYE